MTSPDRPTGTAFFNPPLRIFANITPEDALAEPNGGPRFSRPKLQRHVNRDRVSRYFIERRFSRASPLD